MKIEGNGKLLKIFICEGDQWHGEPLYHAIIRKAKEHGLAGATIVKGIEGFGTNSRIHTRRIEALSNNLPVEIEIIDSEEKINEIIKVLEPMMSEGLMMVLKNVEIIKYTKENKLV